jgi:hypothetical protein
MPVLAALAAQAASEPNARALLMLQLEQWRGGAAVPPRLASIYALLAGPEVLPDEARALHEWLGTVRAADMTWFGAFALFIWYCGDATETLDTATRAFVESAGAGASPLAVPWHAGLSGVEQPLQKRIASPGFGISAGVPTVQRDALLLLLENDRRGSPDAFFALRSALAHSPDEREARLPFLLLVVLVSLARLSPAAYDAEAAHAAAAAAARLEAQVARLRADSRLTAVSEQHWAALKCVLSARISQQAARPPAPPCAPEHGRLAAALRDLGEKAAQQFLATGDWESAVRCHLLAAGSIAVLEAPTVAAEVRTCLRSIARIVWSNTPPSEVLLSTNGAATFAEKCRAAGVADAAVALAVARRGVLDVSVQTALPALAFLARSRGLAVLGEQPGAGGAGASAWAVSMLRSVVERAVLPPLLSAQTWPDVYGECPPGMRLNWETFPGGSGLCAAVAGEATELSDDYFFERVIATLESAGEMAWRTKGRSLLALGRVLSDPEGARDNSLRWAAELYEEENGCNAQPATSPATGSLDSASDWPTAAEWPLTRRQIRGVRGLLVELIA